MKLVNPEFETKIIFEENVKNVWVIESPVILRKILNSFSDAIEGRESDFVLSEGEKILEIQKNMDIVKYPLNININEKKFVSKLHYEIKTISEEYEFLGKTRACFDEIERYFCEIEQSLPYNIEWDENGDISKLIKAFDVHFEDCAENDLERLIQYTELVSNFLNIKILVFLNLKSFFEKEDIISIYKMADYLKIHLLLIENIEREHLEGEKVYIMDKSMCEIF